MGDDVVADMNEALSELAKAKDLVTIFLLFFDAYSALAPVVFPTDFAACVQEWRVHRSLGRSSCSFLDVAIGLQKALRAADILASVWKKNMPAVATSAPWVLMLGDGPTEGIEYEDALTIFDKLTEIPVVEASVEAVNNMTAEVLDNPPSQELSFLVI